MNPVNGLGKLTSQNTMSKDVSSVKHKNNIFLSMIVIEFYNASAYRGPTLKEYKNKIT